MQSKLWLSTTVLTGILAASWLSPAAACGYHGTIGNYFSVMYPSSLVVAVALKRASDEGIIDKEETDVGTRRPELYMDAVRRLHKLEAVMAQSVSPDEPLPNFALGFVESGLWTRYSFIGGQVRMEIHASGPAEGDAVVLTAESALERLLSGALSSEDALSRELIVIDAPSIDREALRSALTRAFHLAGGDPPFS